MKKFNLIIVIISLCCAMQVEAQIVEFVASRPNYSIDINKVGSGNPTSAGGLFTYSGSNVLLYNIGKESDTKYARGVYQWSINDLAIPQGSTIHSVTVSFDYSLVVGGEATRLNFFNCNTDITSPNLDLTSLWNSADKNQTVPIGEGAYARQGFIYYVKATFNSGSEFVTQFLNSINQYDRFTLGIAWKYEDPGAGSAYWLFCAGGLFPSISVSFTPPTKNVTLDQRLSNNAQVGKLRKWEGTYFTPPPYINPGTSFDFAVSSKQTLQGDQQIYSNEKNHNWDEDQTVVLNHNVFTITQSTNTITSYFKEIKTGITIKNSIESSTASGGFIQYKDPWLVDYADPLFSNTKRNRGMKDTGPDKLEFKERSSPFYPDCATNYNGDVYQGVFLNEGYTIPGGPCYSVKAISPQPINIYGKSRSFYFHKWAATPSEGAEFQNVNSAQTNVVFKSDGAVVSAIMKGAQLSNTNKALSTNSQNKIVRTSSGKLFQVYESLEHVWCEKSTDDGNSWELFGSIPLNGNDTAKHPSIAWFEDISESRNLLGITYQLKTSTGSVIYAVFYDESGEYQFSGQISSNTVSWSTNAHPVISIGSYSAGIEKRTGMIVWENSGLRFSYFSLYGGINLLQQDVAVSGAGSSSINPSISVRSGENSSFQLAWEASGVIYYNYASPTGNMVTWGTAENISDGCGYTENFTPSIVSFNQSVNKGSRVCWVGRKFVDENTEEGGEAGGGGGLPKTSAETGNEERRVVFHDPENSSAYWHFGYNVRPPVINKSTNSNGTDINYAFAWTVGNSSYFADNTLSDLWPISTFADSGICLSNGFSSSDLSDMYASIQNTASLPYYFQTTDNLQEYVGEGFPKTKHITIASGREGIIRKGGAHFYYCLGDILLDGNKVKFVDYPQSLKLTSLEQLNQYTVSAPMTVTDQTLLDYSVMYGVLDTAAAALAFTGDENIRFRVVLLDAGTNEVLGEYDNVVYSQQSIARYKNLAYRLSMQGIGNRSVRLALKIEANGPVGYSLATKLAIDNVLSKRGGSRKQISFAENTVTDYALYQNYPNPFNPATTISYALPKDGTVTLKIYDILGKELRTLANEEKAAGRYTVSFNASSLPSGTYFYELHAGDFREVRKMMLVK